jgi:DinB family protein
MRDELNKETSSETIFVEMVLLAWQTQNTRVDKLLESLSDEELLQETAPGRNTGIYLLGHLAAINDSLFKLLDLGKRLHPELDIVFIENPDKSGMAMPSADILKVYWKEVNAKLTDHFNKMQPAEWFTRHTAVSEEDFVKEPHRNKLNVLITRTTHQSYHLGQLLYLKKNKKEVV